MKVYEYILRVKDHASDKANRIANVFGRARGSIGRFERGMQSASHSTAMFSGVASTLLRYIGPLALAAALTQGATSASRLARQLESTSIAFEVMLGSASQAKSLLTELTDLANITPFTRTELQDSAKLLLNFGVSVEKILPTVRMLGDISGGNAQKMHLVTLAYSQMSAAGRLMGQDLLQMINAGFNPLQEISHKTGLSMAVLKKKMEEGAISSKMVEAAFRSVTREGGRFFGMMDRQSTTFEGRLSTMRDKMELWGGGIGESINKFLSPILDQAIAKLDEIMDKAAAFKTVDQKELDRVRELNTELKPLLDRYEELTRKQRTASEDVELLKLIGRVKTDFPQAMRSRDGKLTDVSLMRGRDFIDRENRAFRESNRNRIDLLKANLTKIEEDLKSAKALVDNPNKLFGEKFAEESRMKGLQDTVRLEGERAKTLSSIFELEKSINKLNDPVTKAAATDEDKGVFDELLTGGKGKKKKDPKGIDRISAGGRHPVNVTINLENLVGVQKFEVTNIKEGIKDMQRKVTEALLQTLNSANYAASQ